jgi:hypothetical protein
MFQIQDWNTAEQAKISEEAERFSHNMRKLNHWCRRAWSIRMCDPHSTSINRNTARYQPRRIESLPLQTLAPTKSSKSSSTTPRSSPSAPPRTWAGCLDKAVPHDVTGICETLQLLLDKLPNSAVVSGHRWATSLLKSARETTPGGEVVELLVDVCRKQLRPILKFLFAGPTGSNLEEVKAGEMRDWPFNPASSGAYRLSWWQRLRRFRVGTESPWMVGHNLSCGLASVLWLSTFQCYST